MIAVDTNILVYAHRRDLPQHTPAFASYTAIGCGRQGRAVAVYALATGFPSYGQLIVTSAIFPS